MLVVLGFDLLGEPPAAWHPVVWYGKLIQRLEQVAPQGRIPQLLYGAVMLMLAAPTALLPAALVHQLAKRVRAAAMQRGCISSGILLYYEHIIFSLKEYYAHWVKSARLLR